MAVVGVHLQPQLVRIDAAGVGEPLFDSLHGGVDLFIIISGFVAWLSTSGRQVSPVSFFFQRFWRVAPLYWATLSIIVAVLLVAPQLVQSGHFDFWFVLASYAFIPAVNPATGLMQPVLIPGWTVNYIIFFWVLFSISLFVPARRRLSVISLLICGCVMLQFLQPEPNTILAFYSSSIMLEFLLGIWICAWYQQSSAHPNVILSFLMLAAGLVLVVIGNKIWTDIPRVITLGLPACLILIAGLRLERAHDMPDSRFFRLLGDASFSLYLSHPIILSAFGQFWRKLDLGDGASMVWFCLIAVAGCIVFALVLYWTIEIPLQNRLRSGRTLHRSGSGGARQA